MHPIPPPPPLRPAPTNASGTIVPAPRVPIPLGARRMPPVNRAQRVEWVDVPVAYAPPLRENSAEWPVIRAYVQYAFERDVDR